MKRTLALFACVLTLLLAPSAALADDSKQTQTPEKFVGVTLTLPETTAQYAYRLTDDYVISRVSFRMKDTLVIEPDQAAQLVVLNWYDVPASYTVTQLNAAGATISEETITDKQLARNIALAPDCTKISVLFNENGSLGGVVAYPADQPLPNDITAFSPAPSACDLLIISAEPGMEWMQFGAVLPTYTREKGITTAVLYVSDYGKRARAYEALAGLYESGYSDYPIFGGFLSDNYDSYKITSGDFDKRALTKYLKETIAALRPKVIVTHSTADSVGAHSVVSECVQLAIEECPSVEKLYCFGAEQGVAATVLDMNTPLNAYDGKTAAEVAQSAYQLHVSRRLFGLTIDPTSTYTLVYSTIGADETKDDLFEHINTAQLLTYTVATPSPSPAPEATATPEPARAETAAPVVSEPIVESAPKSGYSGIINPATIAIAIGAVLTVVLFALAYRPLSEKRNKGDAICFCLVPFALGIAVGAILAGTKAEQASAVPEATAAVTVPVETPAPTEVPAASETPVPTETPLPDLTATTEENYYRSASDPSEVIVVDAENGHWEYRTDDLGIDINRVSTTTKEGKPLTYFVADIHMRDISEFRPGFGAEGHTGRGAIHPWLIARREKAVLWITGDNLINDEREEKGILIRDGRMFWSAEKEDTLAIYPDMSMRIIKKQSMSPGTLLEDGVENAYSFGPTLIDNGVINEKAKYHRVRRANPRTGIGYIEPGHYIAIVVDGRQKDYSVGLAVWDFADLFAEYGCTVAYNLDGGLSAAMIFMGEQLNSHSGNRMGSSDDISYQRAVPDGLMFGYSEQVPSVDDPIGNNGNKN